MPRTSATVFVRDPFETASPVSVPVTVELLVQHVDSTDVVLRGIEVAALDAERREIAAIDLGNVAFADAPDAQRTVETEDRGLFGSSTVYEATWTLAESLETPAVPAWLTFRVGELWFGDEDETDDRAGLPVTRGGESTGSEPLADCLAANFDEHGVCHSPARGVRHVPVGCRSARTRRQPAVSASPHDSGWLARTGHERHRRAQSGNLVDRRRY